MSRGFLQTPFPPGFEHGFSPDWGESSGWFGFLECAWLCHRSARRGLPRSPASDSPAVPQFVPAAEGRGSRVEGRGSRVELSAGILLSLVEGPHPGPRTFSPHERRPTGAPDSRAAAPLAPGIAHSLRQFAPRPEGRGYRLSPRPSLRSRVEGRLTKTRDSGLISRDFPQAARASVPGSRVGLRFALRISILLGRAGRGRRA